MFKTGIFRPHSVTNFTFSTGKYSPVIDLKKSVSDFCSQIEIMPFCLESSEKRKLLKKYLKKEYVLLTIKKFWRPDTCIKNLRHGF